MEQECRICGNADENISHRFREMMFGSRDEFDYIECARCGTIELKEIPDLSNYYPSHYYSFIATEKNFENKWTTRFTARQAAKYFVNGRGVLGKIAVKRKPWTLEHFPPFLIYQDLKLDLRSRILDVGCGGGDLLNVLSLYGFENLTGIDRFVDRDVTYSNGVKIRKTELSAIIGRFDLIMFHHSFEHVIDPVETLKRTYELLNNDRYCLIRIPVLAYAWRRYGKNWVQLDAPRHVTLFTEKGFTRFAEEIGFRVKKVVYDSTAFQFVGSEKYLRGLPLETKAGEPSISPSELFGDKQLCEWEREAQILNQRNEGDQACFYLKKV